MQVEQDDYFRVVSLKATRKHKEHYDKKNKYCLFQGIAPYIGLNFAVYETLKGIVCILYNFVGSTSQLNCFSALQNLWKVNDSISFDFLTK